MTLKIFITSIVLTCSCLLGGCSPQGPTLLPSDHLGYNRAVDLSLNQQLLLNIVRAHFLESSLYVSIENITSRNSIENQGSVGFFNPFNTGGASRALRTLTALYKHTTKQEPSFIYAPETNDKYAIELLQPLRIKALYLVIESEADMGDIIRLMLRRIGPYINFPALPLQKPYKTNLISIQKFIVLTQAITKIYASNGYTLFLKETGKADKIEELVIPITRNVKFTPQERRLLSSIGIKPGDPYIILSDHYAKNKKDTVFIQVRSLINVTDFLSFAVTGKAQSRLWADVVEKRRIHIYKKYQKLLTEHLVNITSNVSRPPNAYISIQSHGLWFSIMNDDISSKTTFRLFRLFNDLTQANTKTNNILIAS